MLSPRHRKAASVALVALAVAGVRTAAAAGTDVTGMDILVGSSAAERCGSGQVEIDYDVAYDVALHGYGVTAVRLSGLAEQCQGRDVVVTLSGPGGVTLTELSSVVGASQERVVVPAGTPVAAEQLTGVSIVLVESAA